MLSYSACTFRLIKALPERLVSATDPKDVETAKSVPLTQPVATEAPSEVQALKDLVKSLQKEIADLKSKQSSSSDAPAQNSAGSRPPNSPEGTAHESEGQADEMNSPSLEAARQRLRRMCIRNKQGNLKVPTAIHEKYVAGGEERERLLEILIKANFQKNPN